MKSARRLATASALAVAVVAAFATPALAHTSDRSYDWSRSDRHSDNSDGSDGSGRFDRFDRSDRGADHVVFVQTDNLSGNAVVAYDRADDGTLTRAGTYPTGGNGGMLTGSVVDHLASQASLTYDDQHSLLFAVNAGSNTVSVFSADGDRLTLRQVVPSNGAFPVSVAVHDDLVYVLNARAGGSVQGYGIFGGLLYPLGSNRTLGLNAAATPEFVNTPGQVAFSPDGSQLIVTTKANGSSIDVFRVYDRGTLSAAPVVNPEPGTVPFAVTFDRHDNLVVTEAGTNAVATFDLHNDGTITLLQAVPTGQMATCWIVAADGQFYASNAGSASVSRFGSAHHGNIAFIDNTATDQGTVDAAASTHGDYLYVQAGANGNVDEYRINGDGSLTQIGSVVDPDAIGGEGIVAV